MQEYGQQATRLLVEPLLSMQSIQEYQCRFHRSKVRIHSKKAKSYLRGNKLTPFPPIELPKYGNILSLRRPFPIHKLLPLLMNPIAPIALRDMIQSMLALKLPQPLID
jgi:hypothetical protein